MSDEQLEKVAVDADFIVNGYAFTKTEQGRYRVLNLNNDGKTAALLGPTGEMLETDMDDIELGIVVDYLKRNLPILAA